MNRMAITAISILIACVSGLQESNAQVICPLIVPDRTTLLSDGTVGVAFGRHSSDPALFDGVREIDPEDHCFGTGVVTTMKRACEGFIARHHTITSDPIAAPEKVPAEECVIVNKTIALLAEKNIRLRRTVRALRARVPVR